MATAATSLLGLALPVTGELSGTWGDTVNVSITALLDTAVAGTTTLSSDADVTLTTTTLAANQARQAIILWTAGGTVTRTITVPAQSKSYIVINKTSGSQSIKIVGAGPTTGVTIVAGTAAFVVWNGVDFVTASVTSTTGILPVANGGTGLSSGTSGGVLAYTATGTLASSAALAASALVIGGGAGAAPSTTTTGTGVVTALGVNTGTAGAFVVNGGALGTPSSGTVTNLTGTANITVTGGASGAIAATTLTTSSTVTINGGTANGVGYLNASKVLTTGTALTFDGTTATTPRLAFGGTTLPSAGTATIFGRSSDNNLYLQSGSGNDINFLDGSQNTMLSLAPATVSFNISNVNKLTLNSTGLAVTGALSATGNIKTTGTGTIDNFNSGAAAYLFRGFLNGLSANGDYFVYSDATSTRIGSEIAKNVDIRVNGAAIGTFSSTALALGVGISLTGGTSGTGYSFSGSAPANSLTLDSSGNVGIGTSSVGAKLDISYAGGTSANTTLGIKIGADVGNNTSRTVNTRKFASIGGANYSNSASNIGIVYCDSDSTTSVISIGGGSSGVYDATEIRFITAATTTSTTGSQRMTLDSSGNLLVGTTSAASKLTVASEMSIVTDNNNRGIIGWDNSLKRLGFGTINASTAYFDSMSLRDGNLLVGTTSQFSNAKLTVSSTATDGIASTQGTTGGYCYLSNALTNGGTFYHASFGENGTQRGSITSNGTVTVYNTTSDYRLKTVIGAVTGQGARIDALEPVEYTWNSNGSRTRGFLAHQFQEVYASSVTGTKDAVDADGKPVYQAMQASTSEVIADLVAELQSLRARVAQLESKP